MTNEELATAVQAGDREPLELWDRVWKFTRRQALRCETAWGVRGGVTVDDFTQAAYIGLLDALDAWEPGQYRFTTFYGRALKSAFLVACGGRSVKQQADPLRQGILSLDVPLNAEEPDGATLGDLQPDPAAEAAMEGVVERDRAAHLHAALETALSQLPEDQETAIRQRYYWNQPADKKALQAGLRALRHPKISRHLKEFL